MNSTSIIRLALPGKGTLESATLAFLAECGMKVNRNNPRQYLASVSSMPDLEVVFQRAADIPLLVQDGDATFGITGYDILAEYRGTAEAESEGDDHDDDIILLEQDLGYGNCRLVVAVPETWIDISTCTDLWHLAGYYFAHKKRGLRIATKYPTLTGQFLRQHGITHCKIISPHGALEAAPLTETADLIVDLTETGTTLRENHLKLLEDGIVLRSQACLIGNTQLLRENNHTLSLASIMLELIEARMQARNRSMLTAHLQVEAPEEMQHIFTSLKQRLSSLVSGLELQAGHSEGQNTSNSYRYSISGVTNVGGSASEFLEIVALLRGAGALHINITPLTYRFANESMSVRTLHKRLKRKH
jgi:ATP phosphoribosyltransferase